MKSKTVLPLRGSLLLFLFVFSSFLCRRPLHWVAIGDSITYLNDHPDETGHRMTEGYLTKVTRQLPYIQYTNQGHNGWTAARIATTINQLGLEPADIYTVFLGTNDWWAGIPIGSWQDYTNNRGDSTVYGSFRIILDKLHGLNPHASIILITPLPRTDFVYINNPANNAYGSYKEKNGQTLEQLVTAIATIGHNEKIPVLDLYHEKAFALPHLVRFKRLKDPATGQYRNYPYPEYTSVPFHPTTDEYPYPPEAMDMTYDGLHPSDIGHTLIAAQLVKMMQKK